VLLFTPTEMERLEAAAEAEGHESPAAWARAEVLKLLK